MPVHADNEELVILTDKDELAEAKALFSQFATAFRTMPYRKTEPVNGSGTFVFYMGGPEDDAGIERSLRELESCKVASLVFYVPNHSSDFAFRVGKLVGSRRFAQAEWAFNMPHLRQLLKARNVDVRSRRTEDTAISGDALIATRKRFGLTQTEMAEALGVTARTWQNWERGLGTSQIERKARDLRELMTLMDDYVSAPKEQEWLANPLPAFHGKSPRELIAAGRIRDLVVEFLRLREGQPA